MNIKLLIASLLLSISTLLAQQDVKYKIIDKNYGLETSSIPTYFEFSSENRPAIGELESLMSIFWKGIPEFGLKEISREIDELGFTHIRFEQTYQGIGVELAEWILHTKNGKIHSMNGKLIDQKPPITQESLSESQALALAKAFIGATIYKWEVPSEESHLKIEQNNPSATYFPTAEKKYIGNSYDFDASKLQLTYKFNIYAHEPLSRQEVYVNAKNGSIVFVNNLIHTVNTTGTAVTAYSGTQTITTDSVNSTTFRLRQTVSGNGINTFNLQNGTSYNGAVDFTDADNNWNNVNSSLDQYATDAHWGAEKTYDYLSVKHNRNSINNAGFALNSYVHYSNNFANAFWDGQRMTYGDGNANQTITPLVALDIAGHEIAHGLTTFSANLIYADESGALNESFSDIFGAAIEFYARPNRANWTIGEDIGSIIRSMSNPNQYGDPDTYDGTNWVTTAQTGGCTPSNANDQCGVHSNSGVQNFWFYLLTTGGTGTNDNGNSYSVTGIGIDSAAAIAYRNLTVYLTQSSDFAEARFYSIKSATDIFGACSPEVISVTNAWYAVGVGAAYSPGVTADFVADFNTSCAPPLTTGFTNLSNNGLTYLWDFGDGTTSTVREPTKTYTAYGKYTVSLIADGGTCGIDTVVKTNYIDIDSLNPCVVVLNSGTNATQLNCVGKIFDSGGASGDYGANEQGVITIAPPSAATITLNFAFFDVEVGSTTAVCDYDVMNIYDGSNANAPLLGSYCNNQPPPTNLTSTASSVTIEFISDAGLEEAGFEINWSCNGPTTPPTANFEASDSSSCDGEIAFSDQSTQAPNSWVWDFGDGTQSVQQNPIHTYSNNGTYDVKLVATNAFGTDSIVKTNVVTITRPASPTVMNDTACLGQTATLTASANGAINWYSTEFGGNAVATGNNVSISNLTADSTLWAENFVPGPIQNVGPSNNSIGTGAFFNNFQYLIFDVFTEINLQSVIVYAGSSGNRTIELRNSQGQVLQTLTRYIPSGQFLVGLNFNIPAGTDYQLGVSQGSQPNLYRNNSGTAYPYTIPGKLSITRSSAGTNPTGFYYFFYNWSVKSPDCSSARIPTLAKVDSSCNPTGINQFENSNGVTQIFPNPAANQFTIAFNANSNIETISVRDLTGKLVYSERVVGKTSLKINCNDWSNGVYFIQLSSTNKIETKKIVINNN